MGFDMHRPNDAAIFALIFQRFFCSCCLASFSPSKLTSLLNLVLDRALISK